jgi:SMI1 / KNR4 family (SUKH-1)
MEIDRLARLVTYTLDKTALPASEEVVASFETDLGAQLPNEYRRFLLQSGPVGIEGSTQIPVEGGGNTSVSALYGLGCKRSWDLRHQTMNVYSGRIPDETIPIGEDGDTGDLTLLVIAGSHYGETYVWRHDRPEIDSERLDKMSQDLASSGHELKQMDIASIIHTWEHEHSNELGHSPLWGNVQRIAPSFDVLLDLMAGE